MSPPCSDLRSLGNAGSRVLQGVLASAGGYVPSENGDDARPRSAPSKAASVGHCPVGPCWTGRLAPTKPHTWTISL